jgi:TRAP transporter TAXI family solute receptor
LNRLLARLIAGLLVSVFCVAALAVEVPLNLCTAGPQGNYFDAGREMAAHANPRYLKINVVETAGSMDNMLRMARRECGAAIVQSDAFVVYQARHRDKPVEITRNRFLYAEYAQLVCRRDANVATTGDLLENAARHKVLVGAAESGSALTWHAFTLLDRRYAELPIENVGGEEALGSVLDAEAQCLFFVSGLGSPFAKIVNQRGKDLRLVPITEAAFREAEFGSVTLYESRAIPKGYYPNLEAGLPESGIDTLTVSATLVIDRHWSDRYPNGPSALLGAVTGAIPAIDQRALSGLK